MSVSLEAIEMLVYSYISWQNMYIFTVFRLSLTSKWTEMLAWCFDVLVIYSMGLFQAHWNQNLVKPMSVSDEAIEMLMYSADGNWQNIYKFTIHNLSLPGNGPTWWHHHLLRCVYTKLCPIKYYLEWEFLPSLKVWLVSMVCLTPAW